MFTVLVHNHKDDPYAETRSAHGEFATLEAAETWARRMRSGPDSLGDFLTFAPIEIGAQWLDSVLAIHAPWLLPDTGPGAVGDRTGRAETLAELAGRAGRSEVSDAQA